MSCLRRLFLQRKVFQPYLGACLSTKITPITAVGSLKVIPSVIDEQNPLPYDEYRYDWLPSMSYPCKVEPRPHPVAEEGIHPLTGEIVKFPYVFNPAWDDSIPFSDILEVVDANADKGPIDIHLDGFELEELPKGPGQVYKVKGTGIGETPPSEELWGRLNSIYPQVKEAHLFWRKWGTIRTESLPDEQFDEIWIHFFSNPELDCYELRRGCNIIHDMDLIPEPTILRAIFFACRRLNQYPLTLRVLEGVKDKVPKDAAVYKWVIQELQETFDELGIVTPDSLGLHIAPEGIGPKPY